MGPNELSKWFVAEVLPHEPQLMRFLYRNWRHSDEVSDLLQETYARVFDAASVRIPEAPQAFLLLVARNLLIDRARRSKVVSIETYADMETVMPSADELSPERHQSAWSELRLLKAALQTLPSRRQQVVRLRKIQGLSQREVAAQMGITEDTVERQLSKGIRVLADALGRGTVSSGEEGGDAGDRASSRRKRR